MNKLPNWWNWGLIFPIIVLNGWLVLLLFQYFQSLLTVFIIASLLSFLLEYPVKWLQNSQVPRNRAVFLVLLLAVSTFVVLGLTLIPLLISQINELFIRIPTWVDSGTNQIQALQNWADSNRVKVDLNQLSSQLQERLSTQLQSISGELLNFFVNAISSVVNILLTFVLTFYLLVYGEQLWDGLFLLLPSEIAHKIRRGFKHNFEKYFIGQATLAGFMGGSMIIAFLLMGIPFGLLFGLTIGVLTLFPFGAPVSIALVSILIAFQNPWQGVFVWVVAIIIDQTIENVLAPRLLGKFTGLNPVWILLSLLIGAKLAGVLGLVLAVPCASLIKSLTSSEINNYSSHRNDHTDSNTGVD